MTSRRLAAVDAQMYWMASAIPNDQFLAYAFDGELTDPAEAVRSYHGALEKQGIRPHRSLSDDMVATKRGSAYQASSTSSRVSAVVPPAPNTAKHAQAGRSTPDFAAMNSAAGYQPGQRRKIEMITLGG